MSKKLSELPISAADANTLLVGLKNASGDYADYTFTIVDLATYINSANRVIKTKRTSITVSAGSSNVATVTWDTPFLDGNFTSVVSVADTTTSDSSLSIVHIETITLGHIVVRVHNASGGDLTGTIQAIAIHD